MSQDPVLGNNPPSTNNEKIRPERTNYRKQAIDLTRQLEVAKAKIDALEKEREDVDQGLQDSRHKVRLRCLNHFYSEVVNVTQLLCPEDRLRVEQLIEQNSALQKG